MLLEPSFACPGHNAFQNQIGVKSILVREYKVAFSRPNTTKKCLLDSNTCEYYDMQNESQRRPSDLKGGVGVGDGFAANGTISFEIRKIHKKELKGQLWKMPFSLVLKIFIWKFLWFQTKLFQYIRFGL